MTPIENATKKALAYHKATGLAVTAYDSGLYYYGIPKDDVRQPGLFVRRVGGNVLTDVEMIDHYSSIASTFGGKIRCSYYTGFSIVLDEDHIYEFMDNDETAEAFAFYLINKPHELRTPGWPLDSISIDESTGRYLVEVNTEAELLLDKKKGGEKNKRFQKLEEFYRKSLGISK